MADGQTANYHWTMPGDHQNANTWGSLTNANWSDLDGKLAADVANMTAIKSYLNPNALVLARGASTNASINFINPAAPAGKQTRWYMYENFATESGANVGSDFSLNAYDDTGVLLRAEYVFNRANGTMTFNGVSATFSGTLNCKVTASITGTVATDNVFLGYFNSAAVRQGYVGYINSNASMTLAKDGGTSIVLTSGISLNGPTVITGALTGSSTAAFTGITGTSLTVNGGASVTGTATIGTLAVTGNATITGTLSTGALTATNTTINGALTVTGLGSFGTVGNPAASLTAKNQLTITGGTATSNSFVTFNDSTSGQQAYVGWRQSDASTLLVNTGGAYLQLTATALLQGNTTVGGTLNSTGTATLGTGVGAAVAGLQTRNAIQVLAATASDNSLVNFYDNASVYKGFVGWFRSGDTMYLQTAGGAGIGASGASAVTIVGNTTVNGTLVSTGTASFPATVATSLTVSGNTAMTGTVATGALTATSAQINGTLISTGGASLGMNIGAGAFGIQTKNVAQIIAATASDSSQVLFYDNASTYKGFVGWSRSGDTLCMQTTAGAGVFLAGALTVNITGNTFVSGTLGAGGTMACKSNISVTAGTGSDNAFAAFYNSVGVRQGYCGWINSGDQVVLAADGGAAIVVTAGIGLGGNVTGSGYITGTGYCSRPGIAGPSDVTHQYNTYWNTALSQNHLWLDNSDWGQITTTCDYRMKKDVTPLGSMWERVKALNPISYTHQDWTPPASLSKDGTPLIVGDNVERWGFLAHELQETLVESAANGVKDDPVAVQSPNPFTVIAALAKALQEAMARIEALEAAR